MHEEAILRDLVRKVNEVAGAAPGSRIRTVRIWIGAFSHLTEAELRSRWPTAADGTPAVHARLEVTTSADLADPRALGVVLLSVDLDGPGPPPKA